jgi:hypothetical protein
MVVGQEAARSGAIVGPNGPKNEVDDDKLVTVNAWGVMVTSCHAHENLLESYSCKGV